MKLERDDTEPLIGNQDDFTSLLANNLSSQESIQIPRFDTADINALDDFVDAANAQENNLNQENKPPEIVSVPVSGQINTEQPQNSELINNANISSDLQPFEVIIQEPNQYYNQDQHQFTLNNFVQISEDQLQQSLLGNITLPIQELNDNVSK